MPRRRARVRAPGGPWWAPWRVQLTVGAGAVPGGVQLVGYLRPREAAEAVLDDGRVRFLLALVPLAAPVDELEAERRYPAGGPALRLEYLERC